jgi:hypothetical protein
VWGQIADDPRHKGIVPQYRSKVQCPGIGDYHPSIFIGGQDLFGELIEAKPVRADDLDLAVLRPTHRHLTQGCDNVIGCDGLDWSR